MNEGNETTAQGVFPIAIKQILVPVDMRHPATSERAVATAAWFSRQTGAEVVVLTVATPFGNAITEMPEIHKPDFEAFVAELSQQHSLETEVLFRSHESIDHVIRQVVDERAIDFVIMATHHPRLTDHLFGSHASQAALHNDCSVLVLRSD